MQVFKSDHQFTEAQQQEQVNNQERPAEDTQVQAPLARQQRFRKQEGNPKPAVSTTTRQGGVQSFVSSKRFIPISLPLAEAIVKAYLQKVPTSRMRPSNQEIVVAATMKGMSRLELNPSLTLASGFKGRRHDPETGKELVFWVNSGVLGKFRPLNPKGFLELCALEALNPGSWQQHSECTPGKPSREEVMGIF